LNVDWKALRAVVIESDDWGLCAWCPDAHAHRALNQTPVFRSAAGVKYGGSTLESAEDVAALAAVLGGVRGRDGFAAVVQANTIVANPDYAKMDVADTTSELPLLRFPRVPSRWDRAGLWDAIEKAIDAGVWWPELHGLHHLPETAWREALKAGADDARRAFEQQSPVCAAVQASGEYDPFEPAPRREQRLSLAVRAFAELFGRAPGSLCPPDYRWDDFLEAQSEALGIEVLQGKSEQHDVFAGRLRRIWQARRWPRFRNRQLYMPGRIAFEPRAGEPRTGGDAAHAAVRAAWGRGQPAVLSTHRVNYVHLDADASRAGREALAGLLDRLASDGAIFLTDVEVAQLVAHDFSMRPIGTRGARLRRHGAGGRIAFAAPAGVGAARFVAGTATDIRVEVSDGRAEVELAEGDYEIEWSHA